MTDEIDYSVWTNWKAACCPDCGIRSPCYYSPIDDEITLHCKYHGEFKVRKVNE